MTRPAGLRAAAAASFTTRLRWRQYLEEFGTELIDAARGKSTRSVQRLVSPRALRAPWSGLEQFHFVEIFKNPVVGGRVRIEVIADGELRSSSKRR